MEINENQIVVLTSGRLKDFAAEIIRQLGVRPAEESAPTQKKEYVYGLRGIRQLFGVSHCTAQQYKNTFLQPAISQRGRKIIVDVNMARNLFAEHNSKTN